MNIDSNKIVSITEANQNFSRVAKMVDTRGEIYIFENNKPKYKLIDIDGAGEIEMSDDEKVDFVVSRLLRLYNPALEDLAK